MIRPSRILNNRYSDRLKGIIRHWPEAALSISSFVRFMLLRVGTKTVLLVEPNAFHGEVLPGFFKYFQDLGYTVVLVCRYANVKENAFCRTKEKPAFIVFDPSAMRWVLRSKKIMAFEFVFLSSRQIFAPDIRVWGDYLGYLGSSLQPHYGNFYIEHGFPPNEQSYLINTEETFLLTQNTYKGTVIPMLNPHWFGEIAHSQLNKKKRVFIAIGEMSVKNCSIPALIDSVRELEKKFDFEVWLVGKGADSSLSEALPTSIRTFGRLPFDRMFDLLEKADFLLPLLDPENDSHKHYLTGVTSGSRQLILGFLKIPVIHAVFAKIYDFSGEDAILHDDGGLKKAMERALTMTDKDYSRLQKGLKRLAQTVYQESLENLRKRIAEKKSANSQ